jgi:DNA invertase Pin-like site-specific DNA recombinase
MTDPPSAAGDDRSADQPPQMPLRTVDGYVTSAPSDGIGGPRSAWMQQRQVTGWARARGWRVARIFEDAPSTGSAGFGPLLCQALDRVASRESDGIVVARLNHLAVSLPAALEAIERIQSAGGTFVSVGDGIDLATPTGQLMLGLLLSVVDW